MLGTYLLGKERTAEEDALLERYTEVLVEHGSPEGALILEALIQLEDRWPVERRAAAAAVAADAAEGYMNRSQRPALEGSEEASKQLHRGNVELESAIV